jgi:hypothetical protein
MVIILILIEKWIRFATLDEFYIKEDASTEPLFGDYLYPATFLIGDCRFYAAIIVTLLFVRMTRMFSFSSKLTMFSDVLLRAQMDIIFFFFTFIVFIIVFSLIGNIIFGVSDVKFQDFGTSIFYLFLITIQSINSHEIIFYSRTFTSVFGLVYLFIIILLLNMFVAIIISHYIEYYTEQGYLKDSVIKLLVKSILAGNPPQIKDKKSSSIWTRLKYKILIRFHRFAYSIKKEFAYLEEQARCKLA